MKTTFKDVLGTDAPAGRIVKRIRTNRTVILTLLRGLGDLRFSPLAT